MKRILFLAFYLGIYYSSSSLAAQIPPFYLDSTVVIGIPGKDNTVSWSGTGFLLGTLIDKAHIPTQYRTYLVTNKHVIDELASIYVRFNPVDGESGKDYPIPLIANKKRLWVGHHDKEIDVAVILVNTNVLNVDKMKYQFIRDDMHVYNKMDMLEAGVTEGDPIYLLGYPLGIVDSKFQYVIARYGIIARIRDMLANNGKSYLIDTNNYPGNSGGPVILKTEISSIEGTKRIKSAKLIGMVDSYIPYRDIAVSKQTKQTRIIFEENSGLANVIPVDYILETIQEYNQQYNIK